MKALKVIGTSLLYIVYILITGYVGWAVTRGSMNIFIADYDYLIGNESNIILLEEKSDTIVLTIDPDIYKTEDLRRFIKNVQEGRIRIIYK